MTRSPIWTTLPRDWQAGQVKNLADVTLGKMLQPKARVGDAQAPYLRAANVQPDGVLISDDMKSMWFSPDELTRMSVETGDVVVVEGGQGGFGRAAYVNKSLPGVGFQNSINRLRPRPRTDGRFLAYYLLAVRANGYIHPYCNVVSMPHLTAEKLAALPAPIPPSAAQTTIADYLDRETAQIDTLIAEQTSLRHALQERRRAAIAEAVMSAGNPLNDSQGWPKVGHFWDVSLGKMLDAGKAIPDGSVSLPYVRAGNIQDNGLDLSTANQMPFSPEEANSFDLRAGDLLVVEGGAVGTNVTLAEDMPGWAFQKTVNRLRPRSNACSRWLGYVLRTYRDAGIIDIVCNKSTIAHLTAEKLRGLPVPPASATEQRRIAAELDDVVAHIDSLMTESNRFIALARERRSALITAAVTGYIEIPEAS